ncbi:hypothetical protein AArcSl_0668 [Halalkaliarchaeum desulfuricum]|uniref:Uncharacterized protein n=1 Tax=Halalkaliarchaeum desulfuricum TaxID=2055893 RepID=A0A343TGU6_9EURY|nr:hypothetical protein AArcSl_0668 [Halalkaliarchaeum desulfuricum]
MVVEFITGEGILLFFSELPTILSKAGSMLASTNQSFIFLFALASNVFPVISQFVFCVVSHAVSTSCR